MNLDMSGDIDVDIIDNNVLRNLGTGFSVGIDATTGSPSPTTISRTSATSSTSAT